MDRQGCVAKKQRGGLPSSVPPTGTIPCPRAYSSASNGDCAAPEEVSGQVPPAPCTLHGPRIWTARKAMPQNKKPL